MLPMISPKAAFALLAMLAMSIGIAEAQTKKRTREREKDRPPAAQPADKRDRMVNAAGTPFHGRAYWLALSQCGGIYFRLGTLYEEAAIQAQIRAGKQNPKIGSDFLSRAAAARKTATSFFVGAENFLMADRSLSKEDAILTYDPRAAEAGDRLKSVDAALQAAQPCPALYQTCHSEFVKICPGILAQALRDPISSGNIRGERALSGQLCWPGSIMAAYTLFWREAGDPGSCQRWRRRKGDRPSVDCSSSRGCFV